MRNMDGNHHNINNHTSLKGRKYNRRCMDDVHEFRQKAILKFLNSHDEFDYDLSDIKRAVNLSYQTTMSEVDNLIYRGLVVVTRRTSAHGNYGRAMYQTRDWMRKGNREAERMIIYRNRLRPSDLYD